RTRDAQQTDARQRLHDRASQRVVPPCRDRAPHIGARRRALLGGVARQGPRLLARETAERASQRAEGALRTATAARAATEDRAEGAKDIIATSGATATQRAADVIEQTRRL